MDSFLRWFRRLGIPLVGLLFYMALVIVYPQTKPSDPAWNSLSPETWGALGLGVVLAYLTFETGVLLSRYLDRHVAWAQRPLRRVALQMGLQTALALLFTLGIGLLYVHLYGYDNDPEPVRLVDLLPLLLVGLFTSFLLSGTYIGASFFSYWQVEAQAREEATADAALARLHALQQQLDPHFLFNTLSTLTAVIEADPARAVTFVERMATVYRYVLQHRHAGRVPLHTELHLVRAYLFLLQTRHPEGLAVEICVGEEQQARQVLPMVVQLLVENAVKHNRIEAEEPLRIRIRTEDQWLVVENNRQPLADPAASTGVGLRNVARRYEAADATAPVRVESTPDCFRVRLPLLTHSEVSTGRS
jgi:hypothetical protein